MNRESSIASEWTKLTRTELFLELFDAKSLNDPWFRILNDFCSHMSDLSLGIDLVTHMMARLLVDLDRIFVYSVGTYDNFFTLSGPSNLC